MSRKNAFTLIELLVVISIIAVLLALMLPTLTTARDEAKKIQCLSNERQMYPAFQSYVMDNKTWWMVAGYNDNVVWARIVTKYLDIPYIGEQTVNIVAKPWNNNVSSDQGYGAPLYSQNTGSTNRKNRLVKCPVENQTNYWYGQNATSYGFNSGLTNGWGLGYGDSYTINPTSNYAEKWGRIREKDILKTSEVFVIGDYITSHGYYDYINGSFSSAATAATVHNGGCNFLFADGHAGSLRKEAITLQTFRRF